MAISATTVWHVRPSGNNANGGGYDAAVSGVLATTLSGTLATGATSASVTSFAGWPGSGNYYARLGATIGGQVYNEIVQITAGQGTGTWTIVRSRLGTSDPGVTWPAGTVVDNDLSQCDTAVATGTAGTSNASTTFSDAGLATNTTFPGNILWLASGTNGTPGPYIIQSVTNPTTVVLDRNCSTGAMANGVWKLGGAWADPQTNLTSALNYLVPGNMVYVLGSGAPNFASYTYDYTLATYVTTVSGNATNGRVRIIGDPATPSGGVPCLRLTDAMAYYFNSDVWVENIWFVANGTTFGTYGVVTGDGVILKNITYDQFGYDVGLYNGGSVNPKAAIGCRVFSSVAKRSTNAQYGIGQTSGIYGTLVLGCNISGCIGSGVFMSASGMIKDCLITKNGGDGLTVAITSGNDYVVSVNNNTIDGNSGNGVWILNQAALESVELINNTISNHTTSGKYPITVGAGTAAQNDRVKGFIDYNVFYNNLNAPNAISYGAHDQVGGADPYVDQANNDYTLTSTYVNTGYPQTNFPGY